MSENTNDKKKKKTLSLKLGAKPVIAPNRNIEAGKTVIVEKKRFKRNINNDSHVKKTNLSEPITNSNTQKIRSDNIPKVKKKSGIVLKPLSKDEQKK